MFAGRFERAFVERPARFLPDAAECEVHSLFCVYLFQRLEVCFLLADFLELRGRPIFAELCFVTLSERLVLCAFPRWGSREALPPTVPGIESVRNGGLELLLFWRLFCGGGALAAGDPAACANFWMSSMVWAAASSSLVPSGNVSPPIISISRKVSQSKPSALAFWYGHGVGSPLPALPLIAPFSNQKWERGSDRLTQPDWG